MDGLLGGGADSSEDEFGVTEGVLHVGQRLWPRHRVEPPELVGDASRIGLERSSVALEQIGESLADVRNVEHRLVGDFVETHPQPEVVAIE